MMRSSTSTTLTTAALLAASLACAPVLGQNQVQNGSAHDANQQVGSGGYNRPAEQVDYRARNLLITGNVGGGRAFQGEVGYTAPGEFQGTLGSDTLFNFRRDSIYSSIGLGGLQARGFGDQVIVTRPTTAVPGYQVGNGYNLANRSTYDPRSGVLTFRQDSGALVSVTGISDPQRFSPGVSSLGLVQTPQGLVSIDASPLTGIRYNPLDANTPRRLVPDRDRVDITPTDPGPLDPRDVDPRDVDPDRSITPDRRIEGQRDPNAIDRDAENPFNPPEDPLSVTLGMQVQSAMQLQLAGRVDNNIPNAQAQLIRDTLFAQAERNQPGQPNEAPKPPENPYDKVIADILAQSRGEPVEPGDAPAPGSEDKPRWQQILESPDAALAEAKRKSRETAVRISLGMVDENGNVDFDQELPTIDPDSELGKLLDELDYDLPRVQSLAGIDENRINTLLTRGEQELKAGRYTLAEGVYRQVLRETGEQPLAKAGLVHSQMGAGMIRSAAFNLRGLFSDHPELIALRYDEKLLPDNDRLRWLQTRLINQINDETTGSEPGLILAYLGYQMGPDAKSLVEFGLNVAETAAPRDPLMPILRRIWLEGGDAEGEGEAEK
ncbi:MAG: hypothetical protein ACE37H_06565 [Phycisphaeraceae bacterium]